MTDVKNSDRGPRAVAATADNGAGTRLVIIAVLVVGAFFGAYRFAQAQNTTGGQQGGVLAPAASQAAGDPSAAGGGCACCGSSAPTEGGLTGEKVEGVAKVEGNVQKISVDVSNGFYEPNQIVLKAGVPAEITFANGTGCTSQVMSNELGFFEDMTGGPVTVKIPAQEAGEYPFYCGMQMVYGKIVVQ